MARGKATATPRAKVERGGIAENAKAKAIELAVSSIEKQFGKGAITKMTDDAVNHETPHFSSGSQNIVSARGNGGLKTVLLRVGHIELVAKRTGLDRGRPVDPALLCELCVTSSRKASIGSLRTKVAQCQVGQDPGCRRGFRCMLVRTTARS